MIFNKDRSKEFSDGQYKRKPILISLIHIRFRKIILDESKNTGKISFVSYNRLSEWLQTLNTNKTVSYYSGFERLMYCIISHVNFTVIK